MAEQIWMVRAGEDSAFIADFLNEKQGMVAIGWAKLGDLTDVHGREQISDLMRLHYPDYTKAQLTVSAGQVYRFRDELKPGFTVVTYDSSQRKYSVGEVKGEYVFQKNLDPELQHTKAVNWQVTIDRDSLSPETKRSLGSIATIFCISESASAEIKALLRGESPPQRRENEQTPVLEQSETQVRQNIEQSALDFLQDRLAAMSWSDMQDLVAGLFRAMGYKTRVAPPGPDRGRDVIASPDGFGFQTPRIIVEVKHRTEAMGAQQLRSFLAGLRNGDSGLYVSTGGFTKEARYEAERANHHIALMDGPELAKAIVDHYDAMDAESRTLLPLKKIYWPA